MVFSSWTFLFAFLPAVLGLYAVSPAALRNSILLCSSLVFYAWGAPHVVPLLVGACALDIVLSNFFATRWRRPAFVTSIVANVAMLAYFKYSNFFVENLNILLSGLGFSTLKWINVALPAGVSFYTFEKISYLVDVYRGTVPPTKSLARYLLFVSFFPHLIAGPILRYAEISKQIAEREHSKALFFDGVCRLSIGLARKVLIADELGAAADNILNQPPEGLSAGYAWFGITLYSLQIYFDFSGYSDMAIGLARMFGFRFAENFNHPYIASSISDFWRRWHISFSQWMRDYLYVPLGGSRGPIWRTYINLWCCFLISGLWHGASWNFVLWGVFHGVFLILDRLFLLSWLAVLPRWSAIAITFVLVTFSRVLFRLPTWDEAIAFYRQMFGIGVNTTWLPALDQVCNNRGLFVAAVAVALSFVTPGRLSFDSLPPWLRALSAIVLFILSVVTLSSTSFSPFLYYQF